jgi:hypothetical protein
MSKEELLAHDAKRNARRREYWREKWSKMSEEEKLAFNAHRKAWYANRPEEAKSVFNARRKEKKAMRRKEAVSIAAPSDGDATAELRFPALHEAPFSAEAAAAMDPSALLYAASSLESLPEEPGAMTDSPEMPPFAEAAAPVDPSLVRDPVALKEHSHDHVGSPLVDLAARAILDLAVTCRAFV